MVAGLTIEEARMPLDEAEYHAVFKFTAKRAGDTPPANVALDLFAEMCGEFSDVITDANLFCVVGPKTKET